jgi:hypothetical protein
MSKTNSSSTSPRYFPAHPCRSLSYSSSVISVVPACEYRDVPGVYGEVRNVTVGRLVFEAVLVGLNSCQMNINSNR